MAAAGCCLSSASMSALSTCTARRSLVTTAVAVRGPPSMSDSSPKKSPGPGRSSTMRSPVSFLKKISTSPSRTM